MMMIEVSVTTLGVRGISAEEKRKAAWKRLEEKEGFKPGVKQ